MGDLRCLEAGLDGNLDNVRSNHDLADFRALDIETDVQSSSSPAPRHR